MRKVIGYPVAAHRAFLLIRTIALAVSTRKLDNQTFSVACWIHASCGRTRWRPEFSHPRGWSG